MKFSTSAYTTSECTDTTHHTLAFYPHISSQYALLFLMKFFIMLMQLASMEFEHRRMYACAARTQRLGGVDVCARSSCHIGFLGFLYQGDVSSCFCLHTCMHAYTHACTHAHNRAHKHTHTHTHTNTHAHACTHAQARAQRYTHARIKRHLIVTF